MPERRREATRAGDARVDGRAPRRHRERHAAGRRRPLRGQARRRRRGRRRGRRASPTATTSSRARCCYRARRRRRVAAKSPMSRSATTAGAAHFTVDRARPLRYTVAAGSIHSVVAHDFARADRRRGHRATDADAAARAHGTRRASRAAATLRERARLRAARAPALATLADARACRARRRPLARRRSIASARASRSWYELFPRSAARRAGHARHASPTSRRACRTSRRWASTCSTCRRSIRSAARERKGRNNALGAEPDDVGSPWAIGAAEGGHTAIHPELGTLEDFRRLRRRRARRSASRSRSTSRSSARPTIRTCKRASGVVPQAARRHDPVRREPAEEVPGHLSVRLRDRRLARAVGGAARACSTFWIGAGRAHLPRRQPAHQAVRVLGVGDRARSSASIPTSIFLAEAFTRPKVMHRLAKLGFTQSYTYFTWRNTQAASSTEYFTELTQAAGARVLPAQLLAEHARHPARVPAVRRPRRRSWRALVLAATLGANYGIYGRRSSCWSTRRASPAARSTSTRRSTSCGTGTSTAPTACADFIARVNRDPPRAIPRCSATASLRFHADRQRPAHRATRKSTPDGRTSCSSS